MGYIRNFSYAAFLIAIVLYLLNGLFAPAEAYYPKIMLIFIPESLHKTRLWESIFLENPHFWYGVCMMAAIIAGWKMKSPYR